MGTVSREKLDSYISISTFNTPYGQVRCLGKESRCPASHSNLMIQGKPHWDGLSFEIERAIGGEGGSFLWSPTDKPVVPLK